MAKQRVRWTTLDFIANLLAHSAEQRLTVCTRFYTQAPLLKAGLVESRSAADTPWLAHAWAVDELWRNWLLDRDQLDASLSSCARLLTLRTLGLEAVAEPAVCKLLKHTPATTPELTRLRLILQGPHGAG